MAQTQDPIIFCINVRDPCDQGEIEINFPFGIGEVKFPDSSCEGLFSGVGSLQATMSGFMPLIKIVGCIMKVIEIMQIIPDIISNPLKVSDLTKKLGELGECISFFSSFTGLNPLPICLFIYNLLSFIIAILCCIVKMVAVALETDNEIVNLKASGDLSLQRMGECLELQNETLKLQLTAKLDGIQVLLLLLNTLIGAIPPLVGLLGDSYPISPANMTSMDVEPINAIIDVLAKLQLAAKICAGIA